MLTNKIVVLPLLLLGLSRCNNGPVPEDAARERQAIKNDDSSVARSVSRALPTSGNQSAAADEQLYRKARAAAVARKRQQNEDFVTTLGFSREDTQSVLDVLESQLQAKMEIADYMRSHKEMGIAQLSEQAQQPGNSHLAELLRVANPKVTRQRISSLIAEEPFNRYMNLKAARARRSGS